MILIYIDVKKDHILAFESEAVPPVGARIYVSSAQRLEFAKLDPTYYTSEHIAHLKRVDGQTYEIVGQTWEMRLQPSCQPVSVVVRLQARLV